MQFVKDFLFILKSKKKVPYILEGNSLILQIIISLLTLTFGS